MSIRPPASIVFAPVKVEGFRLTTLTGEMRRLGIAGVGIAMLTLETGTPFR